MSGYGDVKRRVFLKILIWLQNNKGVEVKDGGRHKTVKAIETGEKFPIPCDHPIVNKHIIKAFSKWLEENNVCTKKEFDQHLK